ncbi:uncharacterized protein BDCG_01124 [Blastomyces dermatitidis ER-3]|uniref:Uncharacterized protein n=1 Tax=Ajellomyces dermatitidis (strain ER-3 / ATCC MYA-2586) TaxID=559297 RepID=A0ABP2ELX8_AJEDR|nr:uncharacterized protein BDCG_01124 [Blastomyces dermatitidis ER-3]EEQ84319.2 hypothetical protein BDCG_01124 [Blastomyces dermatitidis ER-3]
MTVPSLFSASPLHPIFKPAAHLIPSPGQPLASSSAVPSFALSVLPVPSAASQAYDHLSSACTISDQAYVNMPRFPANGSHAAAHFCNFIVNER